MRPGSPRGGTAATATPRRRKSARRPTSARSALTRYTLPASRKNQKFSFFFQTIAFLVFILNSKFLTWNFHKLSQMLDVFLDNLFLFPKEKHNDENHLRF
jgi:hypothetical protein